MRKLATINQDTDAYRRGVVLGLTMAEVLLLLVFCLLIATAVVLKRNQNRLEELQEQIALQNTVIEEQRDRIEINDSKVLISEELTRQLTKSINIKDDWRKLMSSQTLLKRLQQEGLEADVLIANSRVLKELQPIWEGLDTSAEIFEAMELSERFNTETAMRGLEGKPITEVTRLASIGLDSETSVSGEHDWPPIISLSEAEEYTFVSGSAELSSSFEQQLEGIGQQVYETVQQYEANIVEVIGHTDERTLSSNISNLDQKLSDALNGNFPIDSLVAADNTGLGMARAVSVARVLKADPRLQNVVVLPLSGGQLILPGDQLSTGKNPGDVKSRRRIEIRVRRPDGEKQFSIQAGD